MAVRIPWNEKEEAILLYYLMEVLQKKISRKTAISAVSKKLREMAVESGKTIDEKFRNENGMSLQMSCLEYAFTKGKSGIAVKAGWYYRIVELYETNREKFEQLLVEEVDRNCMEHSDDSVFPLSAAVQEKPDDRQTDDNRTGDLPSQTAADAGGNRNEDDEIRKNCKVYVSWMIKQGVDQKQAHDSLLALKQCERYAIDKHFTDKSIYLITSVSALEVMKRKLFEEDKIFPVFDKKMNYRFYTAFEQYMKFCKAAAQIQLLEKSEVVKKDAILKQPEEKHVLILRDFFPDGLRQNVIHIKKFIQCYEDYFKEKIGMGREELLSYLKCIGTVRDDRIYAKKPAEQDSLSNEIFAEILHVFQNGGTCIYLSMILQRYARQLGKKLNIYNEEALQALFKRM